MDSEARCGQRNVDHHASAKSVYATVTRQTVTSSSALAMCSRELPCAQEHFSRCVPHFLPVYCSFSSRLSFLFRCKTFIRQQTGPRSGLEKWRFVSKDTSFGVVTRDGTIFAATVPSILAFHLNGTLRWNLTIDTYTSEFGITAGGNCNLLLGTDGTMYTSSTLPTNGTGTQPCGPFPPNPPCGYNNTIYAVNPN